MLGLLVQLLGVAVPAQAETIYALTATNGLRTFDSATPGAISAETPITGLVPGEILHAIDVRPATGQPYVLGLADGGHLYSVNPASGVAAQVGPAFSTPLAGLAFGFDFNPVTDQVRIVSSSVQDLRVNPDTGAVAVDTDLAYPGVKCSLVTPSVPAAAYTNNFAGATSTTLFDYDFQGDCLVRQGSPEGSPVSPDSGQLFLIGPIGVTASLAIPLGLDIGPTGIAYANLRPGVNTNGLYTVNLGTGAATLVGLIGDGSDTVRDITAAAPANDFRFSASTYSVDESAGSATIEVTRSNTIGTASVDFATGNGTATAPSDYTATAGTLSFAIGETGKSFAVPVAEDGKIEGAMTVNLSLSSPRGGAAALASPSTAVLTINDNDVAPVISKASISNKAFAVAASSTASVARKRVPRGTTFRYTLSKDATVTFRIERVLKGRRVGGKCVTPTRKNRKKRSCKRYKKVGSFTQAGKSGANKKKFSGRIGKKKLRPGRYRASLTGTDVGGNSSNTRLLNFKIVRG